MLCYNLGFKGSKNDQARLEPNILCIKDLDSSQSVKVVSQMTILGPFRLLLKFSLSIFDLKMSCLKKV